MSGPPQPGWSHGTFQSTLSSSEALELLSDSSALSHPAVSEQGLEAIQVPSCLAPWLWFIKSCLGKEGRDHGVLAGAFSWVETGERLLATQDISLRALLLLGKTPPGLLGGLWPPLPLGRDTPRLVALATRRWPVEAGSCSTSGSFPRWQKWG